ncbi:hypothetical protein LOK49_LG09G00419 [Camellia lanceoleosa]|uniref:Uncharacterized protein n=1 Tax=Camellia lanceoleosa TaxID=1840588 RepID=A0ACC0GHX0_9ERIC|nr:hypothetical protein LOK49_LG09G00419 [Camellia lanceoleosa]
MALLGPVVANVLCCVLGSAGYVLLSQNWRVSLALLGSAVDNVLCCVWVGLLGSAGFDLLSQNWGVSMALLGGISAGLGGISTGLGSAGYVLLSQNWRVSMALLGRISAGLSSLSKDLLLLMFSAVCGWAGALPLDLCWSVHHDVVVWVCYGSAVAIVLCCVWVGWCLAFGLLLVYMAGDSRITLRSMIYLSWFWADVFDLISCFMCIVWDFGLMAKVQVSSIVGIQNRQQGCSDGKGSSMHFYLVFSFWFKYAIGVKLGINLGQ